MLDDGGNGNIVVNIFQKQNASFMIDSIKLFQKDNTYVNICLMYRVWWTRCAIGFFYILKHVKVMITRWRQIIVFIFPSFCMGWGWGNNRKY